MRLRNFESKPFDDVPQRASIARKELGKGFHQTIATFATCKTKTLSFGMLWFTFRLRGNAAEAHQSRGSGAAEVRHRSWPQQLCGIVFVEFKLKIFQTFKRVFRRIRRACGICSSSNSINQIRMERRKHASNGARYLSTVRESASSTASWSSHY